MQLCECICNLVYQISKWYNLFRWIFLTGRFSLACVYFSPYNWHCAPNVRCSRIFIMRMTLDEWFLSKWPEALDCDTCFITHSAKSTTAWLADAIDTIVRVSKQSAGAVVWMSKQCAGSDGRRGSFAYSWWWGYMQGYLSHNVTERELRYCLPTFKRR